MLSEADPRVGPDPSPKGLHGPFGKGPYMKGIPKWFVGQLVLLEAWGTEAKKQLVSLNMCGCLALAPQASKKHSANKNTSGSL